MTDRDDRLSRAAAEALHALDVHDVDGERDAAGAPFTGEPNEFADTAAELGLAAAPVQPPASMRANLMAMIAVTPQLPAVPVEHDVADETSAPAEVPVIDAIDASTDATTAASPTLLLPAAPTAETPAASEPETRAGGSEPGPAERRAAARWRKPVGAVLAVAAASALFFGGLAIGQLEQTQLPNTQTQAGQLAAIAAAPDSQRAVAEVSGGGTATLVWSGELGRSALLADGLAPLPEGKTYQLWYIGEEGPVPAGTFEPSSKGTTWHVLDGQMHAGDVVGVTVEPSGGSSEPTTDPIVAIES